MLNILCLKYHYGLWQLIKKERSRSRGLFFFSNCVVKDL